MSRLRIAPIVEGHGEVIAVPELLRRIWYESLGGEYIEVLTPIRQSRTKLLRRDQGSGNSQPDHDSISRAVRFAVSKLAEKTDEPKSTPGLVLMLLDANSDCAARVARTLLEVMSPVASDSSIAAVLPIIEYESWFVAAAESLQKFWKRPPANPVLPAEFERAGKAWIQRHFRGRKYSETVDQMKMTAQMDLNLCRQRSQSFDKLCRELERFV